MKDAGGEGGKFELWLPESAMEVAADSDGAPAENLQAALAEPVEPVLGLVRKVV